jgi:hypothetical protein
MPVSMHHMKMMKPTIKIITYTSCSRPDSINEKGELGKKQRTFNDFGPQILKDSRATFAML